MKSGNKSGISVFRSPFPLKPIDSDARRVAPPPAATPVKSVAKPKRKNGNRIPKEMSRPVPAFSQPKGHVSVGKIDLLDWGDAQPDSSQLRAFNSADRKHTGPRFKRGMNGKVILSAKFIRSLTLLGLDEQVLASCQWNSTDGFFAALKHLLVKVAKREKELKRDT